MASSPSKGNDENKGRDSSMNRLAIFGSLGGILSVASYLNGYPINYTFLIVGYFIVAALLWMIIEKKSPKHVTPVLIILAVVFLLGNRCYYEISTAQTQALVNQTPSSTLVSANSSNTPAVISQEPEVVSPLPAATETESPTTNTQDSSGTSIDESVTPNTQVELETYTNSIGMEFIRVPAGTFMMGSEDGRSEPVHEVTIEEDFYIGIYEVTQEQWVEVMGSNPSDYPVDNYPIGCVFFSDVQEFIKRLNLMNDTIKYRLPSEAEWEYACRAGTNTTYSFDNDVFFLEDYAWYDGNSERIPHPVGQKKPNPWGLYDMYGNVAEWVMDMFQNNYWGAPTDGSVWNNDGVYHTVRGGSYMSNYESCTSEHRGFSDKHLRTNSNGFRLVMEV